MVMNDSGVGKYRGLYKVSGLINLTRGEVVIQLIALLALLAPIGVLLIDAAAMSRRFLKSPIAREVFVKSNWPIILLRRSIFFQLNPHVYDQHHQL